MRRSIYNDYRPLRIALLLLIVVLGLLIYMKCSAPCEHVGNDWVVTKEATCTEDGLRHKVCTECETPFGHESIPAKGHNSLAAVVENEVDPTCTVGGSYDEVVYCKTCDAELSRDTVAVDLIPHMPGAVQKENFQDSTHTVAGSYNDVVRCTKCDFVISSVEQVVAPKGHDYTDWTAAYDETTGKFVFTGTCSCGDEGCTVVFTEDDANENLTITVRYDERYAPCCRNQYLVELVYKYEFNGRNIVRTFDDIVEFELESHKLLVEQVKDLDGNITYGYMELDRIAKEDQYGKYYDLADEVVAEHISLAADAVWSDSGFTTAYFVCAHCEDMHCLECADSYTWIAVRLYSAEHDKTLG